ncbi:FtsX-like permease family protein [Actinoplanes sp. NPDC051494]|uniref:FtsX-like permease family protein n=1 Tax=Actinoplanes sp. NPDC051494 TaxID=3363907 RepID=UPI003794EF8A
MGSTGDPLVRAAVLGGLRQRAWSVLTVSAFLVLAAAGAAGPMFAEASDNATFQANRARIPPTARENDAPVVRLSANVGTGSLDQVPVLADLRQVPGLGEPDLTGGSAGAEVSTPDPWESTVGVGDRRERGRLFAVGTPAAELVAVGATAGGGGVWLPEPMVAGLGVRPGDTVEIAVVRGASGQPRRVSTPVAGVYAVDTGGRLPADAPGSRHWAVRQGDTPGDTEYRTLPAYLVIGDVATVERLAVAVDDQIFWSAEAALTPGVTLAQARRTAGAVEDLRRRYATVVPAVGESPLTLRFASGIGRIVATAGQTTAAVRHRIRPVQWAATAVGVASVLAVALLSARRRERELRHAVATGMSPARISGVWLLEHLLPAVLGAALGWLAAWQLVRLLGPPGTIEESLLPAALTGSAVVLAGLATVGAVAASTAARRVRPAPPATARRTLPWTTMLVVVTLVAVAGLTGTGSPAGGVDLLVPLLVLAAAGLLCGWIPGRLGRAARLPTSSALAAVWLARRRLGAGGTERRLAVVVVTTGLGMLLFALSAVRATEVSVDDRIAVAAGAEGVATLEGSWELDDAAVLSPAPDPLGTPPAGPLAGVRVPPLPPGNTVVWRADVTTPLDDDQKDLLIIDPARFGDVALWGRGADLAAARTAVAQLAAAPVDEGGAVRAIAVGDPASARVTTVRATVGYATEDLTVAARVAAFPGMRGRAMYVVAAGPLFARLGVDDPRLRPRTRQSGTLAIQTFLWSSAGAAGVQAVTAPRGVVPEYLTTATQLRQDALYVATGRARGYQVAIAGYLALLAVLTLGIYAQRTAVLRRPSDLMLARIGFGPARIRRARALEFLLLAGVAFAAAVAGVAALTPIAARLLDDQPGLLPRFEFQLSATGLLVTAGTAAVATLLAVALTTVRSASAEEDAYRDD